MSLSDSIIARVSRAIDAEAERIGEDIVSDVQNKCSVQVEYAEGYDGNVTVIRSDPGDYPRRELGRIVESERSEITIGDDVTVIHVINDCPFSRALHDGHDGIEPRPFHDLIMRNEGWPQQIRERIAAAIVSKE